MHLAFGDIHGTNPSDLEDSADFQEVETVICTSDFDYVDSIKEYLALKEEKQREDIDFIEVPGNHDSAIYNNRKIKSSHIGTPYKEFNELVEDLRNDKEARDFVKNLLDEPVQETEINGMDTVIVHGALAGNLRSYPGCPKDEQPLWNRLYETSDYEENLEIMERKEYDLMIRGHDHDPEIVRTYNGEIDYLFPEEPSSYELDGDKNIITHGAFVDDWFLQIEDQTAIFDKLDN